MINNWILRADQSKPFYLSGGRRVVRVCVCVGGGGGGLFVTWSLLVSRQSCTPLLICGCNRYKGR